MSGQTAQGQEEDTIFVSSDSSLLEAVAAGDHLGSSLESVGRKVIREGEAMLSRNLVTCS